ncbi:MAG: KTSC domain-containing protein [Patescibacteria group bacterium]|nr:KTSC domain-containing protein [Patescibacteria group bacterium]
MPDMTPVQSSNLAAAGFEDGEVYVTFRSGGTYAYPGTEDDLAALLSAPSPGKWFAENLKGRSFRRV